MRIRQASRRGIWERNQGTGAETRRVSRARHSRRSKGGGVEEINQALQAVTFFLEAHWLDFHSRRMKHQIQQARYFKCCRCGSRSLPFMLFIYGLGGLFGSQIGGRLSDRFGPNRPMLVALALNAVNLGVLRWTLLSEIGATLAMLIWGFAGWAIFSAQQSRLFRIEPQNGNVVLLLNQSSVYLGSATGALLGAMLLRFGISMADLPSVAASLLLVALITTAVSIASASPGGRKTDH